MLLGYQASNRSAGDGCRTTGREPSGDSATGEGPARFHPIFSATRNPAVRHPVLSRAGIRLRASSASSRARESVRPRVLAENRPPLFAGDSVSQRPLFAPTWQNAEHETPLRAITDVSELLAGRERLDLSVRQGVGG